MLCNGCASEGIKKTKYLKNKYLVFERVGTIGLEPMTSSM